MQRLALTGETAALTNRTWADPAGLPWSVPQTAPSCVGLTGLKNIETLVSR